LLAIGGAGPLIARSVCAPVICPVLAVQQAARPNWSGLPAMMGE
jgi:hypothetical protein